ncbi:hypothetical protein PanWU01x14_223850, partial [Parasponia andersonii]
MKVEAIFRPFGGISHTLDFTLFGIHSTKYEEFLFWTLIICSSTSFVLILPRNMAEAVRYRPWRGKGIRLTASLRRSEFSCPGNRRQHVTPLIVAEMRWLRSP